VQDINFIAPKSDRVDPRRDINLNDKDDDIAVVSNMDKQLPIFVTPKCDKLEPSLEKDRSEKALPRLRKSNTDPDELSKIDP
jgi:hypothetical protein